MLEIPTRSPGSPASGTVPASDPLPRSAAVRSVRQPEETGLVARHLEQDLKDGADRIALLQYGYRNRSNFL